ncbi:unnamed protein product [Trichobilharzia regenti]|nr:unnamed protein product [Trichobilharzia regenti]
MFRNPMEILANDLYKGMKTLGSNYQIMTDIICCCNNTEIYLLKKAYDKSKLVTVFRVPCGTFGLKHESC